MANQLRNIVFLNTDRIIQTLTGINDAKLLVDDGHRHPDNFIVAHVTLCVDNISL
jgi:hypothetical protein